ncbi:MAG: hypothetical protein P1R58_00040 [bacterium]|nr:hypothetical protein [bacterium]
MRLSNANRKRLYLVATIALVIGGVLFWMSDLTSDPPMYYSGLGQSLSTDPAQYVHHARNKTLFDEFDPFDYPRWTVYQHSIISLFSYIWFEIAGVSAKQAAVVGVLVSFLSLLFLLLAVYRYHSGWVSALIAFCFVSNVTLITYGRLTYLENGLLLIASVIFWVYSRWGEKLWGLLLAGALAAAATLTGKLFGALLLPALLLTVFFSAERRRLVMAISTAASFALTTVLLVLILYGTDFSAALAYITEQSYGLRGYPAGLASPLSFVEHLISYGFSNRLFYLDPDILVFMVASIVIFAVVRLNGFRFKRLSAISRLSILWTVIAFLGLMPLNYSPVRYAVIMLPSVIVAFFALSDHLRMAELSASIRSDWKSISLVALAFWLLGYHLIANAFFFNVFPSPTAKIVWITLPFAALAAYGMMRLISKRPQLLSSRNLVAIMVLILIMSATGNGFRIRRLHYLDHNFNLMEANRDVAQILNPEAVLSGPYGPALTMDNEVKSFIHLFGVADIDSSLFDRYPITHLAVDSSNWALAVSDYPELRDLKPVTSYWIRDYQVDIYNISKVFANPTANNYRESTYEQALAAYYKENPDSALFEIQSFLSENPDSKSAVILLIDLLSDKQRFTEVQNVLTALANRHPTDFYIQVQAGRFYQILATLRKDQSLLSLSQFYYERGVAANRFKASYASQIFSLTAQQLRGANPQSP